MDQFANRCVVCGNVAARLDQLETESNKFYTPDGSEATLVENTKDKVVFSVTDGPEAGYYVYDRKSGFGGVQKR